MPKLLVSVPTLADVRRIAANSANIVSLQSPAAKARRRNITRGQVENCCRRGTFEEGPFLNERGDWQVTMYRHAAGEEMRCVVIFKNGKLLVRSNH